MARKRRSDAEYLAMYQDVRRYVTWSTKKTSGFTPAQKRQISMAHAELARIRAAGLSPVRVPRRRGERIGPYRRRVAAVKRANGAAGSPLVAVAARVSSVERARIVGTRVEVTVVRGRGAARRRVQWYMPFDPLMLQTEAGRREEAQRVWDHLEAQGGTRVRFALGARRRGSDDFYTDIEDFVEALDAAADLYEGDRIGHAVVGVYLAR